MNWIVAWTDRQDYSDDSFGWQANAFRCHTLEAAKQMKDWFEEKSKSEIDCLIIADAKVKS